MTLSTEKKNMATVYTVFLAILFLLNITAILGMLQVTPTITFSLSASTTTSICPIAIALLVIYAAFWISQFFLGKKTGLRTIGYAGAALMTVVVIYDIFVSTFPLYFYLLESIGTSASTVISAIGIFVGLIGITGMLLYVLGTNMSATLKILTTGFPVLSLILNTLVLPLLYNTAGLDYTSASVTVSVILIVYLVLLFVQLLVWKKSTESESVA